MSSITAQIIVALISAVSTVLGVLLTINKTRKEDAIEQGIHDRLQNERLDRIEKKLDVHNGYAEKLGGIAVSMTAMQKDIEYLKKGKK